MHIDYIGLVMCGVTTIKKKRNICDHCKNLHRLYKLHATESKDRAKRAIQTINRFIKVTHQVHCKQFCLRFNLKGAPYLWKLHKTF